ncbi:hypothetical protein [Paludibacter sp.]|uniref:hypothetical protein n=1 Tax=Paludibacter sp. TaxID=1898105 RepID=UPI0013539E80|nr:hypothetical protein [Paludibacter sp.]MTK54373.1 hypothetical protein [Paludibacter sp.]
MTYKRNILWLIAVVLLALPLEGKAAAGVSATKDTLASKAVVSIQELESYQRYVDQISVSDLSDLPVGLKKKFGSASVTLAVSQAKFMPNYTQLTVFCKLTLPQNDPETNKPKELYFGASNVKLSHGGGLIGDARLYLLKDIDIPLGKNSFSITLKGARNVNVPDPTSDTYATLTCDGIKEIALAADVVFPKSMLVPLNQNLEADSTQQVTASFKTVISDWNDILAEISLPTFAVKGLERFAISVDKAVVDLSDTRNSADVSFPAGYSNLIPGQANLWRGVYVNKLKISLPSEFKKKGSDERVTFEASRMLIDNAGITGSFAASGILPEGTASGWTFSVNKFFINLEATRLTGGGFEGRIQLPVSQKQQGDTLGIGYKTVFTDSNQYSLQVNTISDINFDLFQAKAHILPGSQIEMTVKDGKFRPRALLNGSLTIAATRQQSGESAKSDQKPVTSIKEIDFEGLVLQTEAPYIQVKNFGYKGDVKLGCFPVTLSGIAIKTTSNEIALTMDAQVNLMAGKISAATKLGFVGAVQTVNETTSFVFKRVDIGAVAIDSVNFGGFSISGSLAFLRDDPVMGNGFAGKLKLITHFSKSLEVDAQAAFGAKDDVSDEGGAFRYWYVQAMATGFNIPITAGLSITGLGGGASYHMLKTAAPSSAVSLCGINYAPDKKYGLGFNAKVNYNGGKAISGDAGFEMMFTSSWGLANMGFYGKIYFAPPTFIKDFYSDVAGAKNYLGDQMQKTLTNIQNSSSYQTLAANGKFADLANNIQPVNTTLDAQASMLATVGINFDFQNSTLHATAEAYIKTPGNIIRGAGQNNKAGWVVLHFAPNEWYVHIGTPTDRIGLKIGIGGLSAQADAYFMVGSRIPGSPAPPPEVSQILNVSAQSLDYMRDLNALGDGKGFAFGTSLKVSTGDLRFLMFYANFNAGIGFDIMLKDYGNAHCEGSSEPIGMNGWYANGQAYAYLQGELGIQVKLLFIKKRIPIVSAGAAVLMQAKLPNPSWFSGQLGGYFSVLGGLIKGRFSFKVTLGEECKIVTGSDNPLDDIKIISDLTPSDKSTQVDVFTTPQAVFNMPVNKTFSLENGSVYRIKLNSFTVTKGGATIPGKLTWNSNNDAVSFESTEILPPVSELKALVSVGFEQQNGSSWQTVYDNGKAVSEQREINFTTGTAPDNIPQSNIAWCYPVKGQKYFFPQEYRQAYVQLKRGQAYLFSDSQYRYQAQFTAGEEMVASPLGYDAVKRQVTLTLPELKTSQAYSLTLAGIPATTGSDNVKQETSTITTNGNDIQVTSKKAAGVTTSSEVRTFLTYNFKTSRYSTFRDKMAAKVTTHPVYQIINTFVGALQADVAGDEAFDDAELWGVDLSGAKPLIQPVAELTDNWYNLDVKPRLYAQYPPAGGFFITKRDTSLVGFPPVRAVEAMSWYKTMSDNEPYRADLIVRLPFRYYLDYYYFNDYRDIQDQVVNRYCNTASSVPDKLRQIYIQGVYPLMRRGKYPAWFRYVLPGNVESSGYRFEFENKL